MRLEHFVVRREPKRTVIWGWDARRGAAMGLVAGLLVGFHGCVMGSGETMPRFVALVGGLVLASSIVGACIGFRVVVDAGGVHVRKMWLGIPYRTRTVPRDVAVVTVYDTFDDPRPDGALVESRREEPGHRAERWILGTSQNADALARAIREEIDRVTTALEPTPTYRT